MLLKNQILVSSIWLMFLDLHIPRSKAKAWLAFEILPSCPIHPNLVDSSEALNDSTRFARQIDFRHVESTAGETFRVHSIESTRIDKIFNPPSKPRSAIFSTVSRKSTTGMSNRQKGKRFMSIRWNRVHESIFGQTNRKYQRRIDSSWVYWATLIKCKNDQPHLPLPFQHD